MVKKKLSQVLPETIPEEIDPASSNVIFNIKGCQKTGRLGLKKLSPENKKKLKKKLEEYSQLSVKDFSVGHPSVRLKRLQGSEGKKKLYKGKNPYYFRISEEFRVRGYFNESKNIFFITELDPNHEG